VGVAASQTGTDTTGVLQASDSLTATGEPSFPPLVLSFDTVDCLFARGDKLLVIPDVRGSTVSFSDAATGKQVLAPLKHPSWVYTVELNVDGTPQAKLAGSR
jgi:hypothetical protein